MTDVVAVRKVIWEQETPRFAAGSPEAVLMGGDPRDEGLCTSLIGRAENGSTDLMLGTWEMQPGEVHLLHHHPSATEAYYVIRGLGEFTVDDEVVQGRPGLTLYMPPGTRHRIVAGPGEPLVLLWVFDKSDFSECGCVWDE